MLKLPLPQREVTFYKEFGKNWRADMIWPNLMVLVECDGGTWINGRHVRPQGYQDDCIKLNRATKLGYHVYRFTSAQVENGEAVNFLEPIILGNTCDENTSDRK